jgi:hypothetical protein
LSRPLKAWTSTKTVLLFDPPVSKTGATGTASAFSPAKAKGKGQKAKISKKKNEIRKKVLALEPEPATSNQLYSPETNLLSRCLYNESLLTKFAH